MTDTPKHTYRDANGDLWFRESLSEGIGNGLRIDNLLYAEASDSSFAKLSKTCKKNVVLSQNGPKH